MKNQQKITKAVIAAAGTGTRFLPATKNQPKEMLPIIDKPIIHYLVEEAVASGIKDIILVTRVGNHIMEDYFDNRYDLEASLEKAGKEEKLEMVKNIPQMANFVYVRQKSHLPYGNGAPLLAVKDLIAENEAFIYMFGDDLMLADKPVSKQIIDLYHEQTPTAINCTWKVPWEEVASYGTIRFKGEPKKDGEIAQICEKLPRDKAPSNTIQLGRFLFTHDVIEAAQQTNTGKDGELWISDILNHLINQGKTVLAHEIEGVWLTTGDPLSFLKATLKFAMQREDLREPVLKYIKDEIL
jgi:UTP--glucose-1-phosphate uridylyltransferase